ncbi:MAG: NADH-quinone oxidoreductase subunit A [Proteobacteria bacterium]|nr:NADH-quinone oxidoreductase subunit A [Pseudomonadota bacterium]MBU1232169.1 NADH-quinone oxidoreductase subunit A [Pseudomonadota bacterium]MBU1419582.1 NADH-quinone oxidoreductase subunit A [Pseudomonadota bacterium]MBU1455868.1 NADH-quinone oxidoreductase subunit A [Pseudomonadota bacterium]
MDLQFSDFLYRDNILWITAFTLGGLAFAFGPIAIVYLFMPRGTRQFENRNSQFIECGMVPIGDSWVRYGTVFFLYALIFLAFDVDVLFLFPVAMAYNGQALLDQGIVYRDFIEVILFVGILSLAIVYAWIKGAFKWERKTYLHR